MGRALCSWIGLAAIFVQLSLVRASEICTSVCVSEAEGWDQTTTHTIEWFSSYFGSSSNKVSVEVREGNWQQEVTDCRNPPGNAVFRLTDVDNSGIATAQLTPDVKIGGLSNSYYVRVYNGPVCMLGPVGGFKIIAYKPTPTSTATPTSSTTVASRTPSNADSSTNDDSNDGGMSASKRNAIIGGVVGGVCGAALLALLLVVVRKRSGKLSGDEEQPKYVIGGANFKTMPYPVDQVSQMRDIDSVLTLQHEDSTMLNDSSFASGSQSNVTLAESQPVAESVVVLPASSAASRERKTFSDSFLPLYTIDNSSGKSSIKPQSLRSKASGYGSEDLSSPILPNSFHQAQDAALENRADKFNKTGQSSGGITPPMALDSPSNEQGTAMETPSNTLRSLGNESCATEMTEASVDSKNSRLSQPVLSISEAHLIAQTFRRELRRTSEDVSSP